MGLVNRLLNKSRIQVGGTPKAKRGRGKRPILLFTLSLDMVDLSKAYRTLLCLRKRLSLPEGLFLYL